MGQIVEAYQLIRSETTGVLKPLFYCNPDNIILSKAHSIEGMNMIYPVMTLENDTEITHSEMLENGEVKVYVETPDEKDYYYGLIYIHYLTAVM